MKVRKDSDPNSMNSIIQQVELGLKIRFALDAAQ